MCSRIYIVCTAMGAGCRASHASRCGASLTRLLVLCQHWRLPHLSGNGGDANHVWLSPKLFPERNRQVSGSICFTNISAATIDHSAKPKDGNRSQCRPYSKLPWQLPEPSKSHPSAFQDCSAPVKTGINSGQRQGAFIPRRLSSERRKQRANARMFSRRHRQIQHK